MPDGVTRLVLSNGIQEWGTAVASPTPSGSGELFRSSNMDDEASIQASTMTWPLVPKRYAEGMDNSPWARCFWLPTCVSLRECNDVVCEAVKPRTTRSSKEQVFSWATEWRIANTALTTSPCFIWEKGSAPMIAVYLTWVASIAWSRKMLSSTIFATSFTKHDASWMILSWSRKTSPRH